MKRCSKCKEEKSLADFPKDKRTPLGVKSECKACHKKRNLELYYANHKRYRDVANATRRDNPDLRKVKDQRSRIVAMSFCEPRS